MIDCFRDENFFLSNFYPAKVKFSGLVFNSAEAAYQAAKSTDRETMLRFVNLTPGKAKIYGRNIDLRPDWDDVKLHVMRKILKSKFSNDELGEKLKSTSGILIEGNHWGDTYWGVCKGKGKNLLGIILMEIREDLRREEMSRVIWGKNEN